MSTMFAFCGDFGGGMSVFWRNYLLSSESHVCTGPASLTTHCKPGEEPHPYYRNISKHKLLDRWDKIIFRGAVVLNVEYQMEFWVPNSVLALVTIIARRQHHWRLTGKALETLSKSAGKAWSLLAWSSATESFLVNKAIVIVERQWVYEGKILPYLIERQLCPASSANDTLRRTVWGTFQQKK